VFAIDVAAYAIMSNHYHIVLHINKAKADDWPLKGVIEHWHQLYKGHALSQRFKLGETLTQAEFDKLSEIVETWLLACHLN
jgi:hypothetical protein